MLMKLKAHVYVQKCINETAFNCKSKDEASIDGEVTYRRCHEKTSYMLKAKLCRGTKKLFPMVNLN